MNTSRQAKRELREAGGLVERKTPQEVRRGFVESIPTFTVTAVRALFLLLFGGASALGQVCSFPTPTCPDAATCPEGCTVTCDPSLGHGQYAGAACRARCVGETVSCTATAAYADDFDDVIRYEQAYDTVKGTVRIPAVGNLPIAALGGNAVCTDDNGTCNPINGSHCAFPCLVSAWGVAYSDPTTGLTLHGLPTNGWIRVTNNEYLIQPGDVGSIGSRFTFVSTDLCTRCCSNCAQTCETSTAGSNTLVPDCDDNDACTTDSGSAGVCQNVPNDCDDANPCTIDDCDPTRGCIHDLMPCNAATLCVNGACVLAVCNGDGVCDSGEDCSACPDDCISVEAGCGNGVCEPSLGENCLNCAADCNGQKDGRPSARFCCGYDGAADCDDARCVTRGFACSIESAESCCGDSLCEGAEDRCNCAVDCGPPPAHEARRAMCADGIDNDCDDLIDRQDPDCACGDKGAPCTSGAACCSNVCLRSGLCR